jgi:hypothetical protein
MNGYLDSLKRCTGTRTRFTEGVGWPKEHSAQSLFALRLDPPAARFGTAHVIWWVKAYDGIRSQGPPAASTVGLEPAFAAR